MTVATQKKNPKPQGDTRQPDLPAMPGKSKAQLRAEELAEALELVSDKKESANKRREQLIGQLKADKLLKVACLSASGVKYRFSLEASEKLKVSKN